MTDAPPHSIAAILPCTDLDASTAFYEKLGLSVVSDHCSYRLLEDGKGWQLHLTNESPEGWRVPGQNPVGIYLYTDSRAAIAERMRDTSLARRRVHTHKPGEKARRARR